MGILAISKEEGMKTKLKQINIINPINLISLINQIDSFNLIN